MDFEQRYSIKEVQEILGISERTVHRWIQSGKLKSYKPGRDHQIPASVIQETLERSEVYPKEAWRSWEEFLKETVGHAHLAGGRDEIADFLRDADSVEDHEERRGLLREEVLVLDEERKKYPTFAEVEMGGVPYTEIRMRYLASIFVSVEVGAITAKEAEREVQELAIA